MADHHNDPIHGNDPLPGEQLPGEQTNTAKTAGKPTPPAEHEQPSRRPSYASTTDDPLATVGTGGRDDPKGKVRPGGGVVPADSDEFERRKQRLDETESSDA